MTAARQHGFTYLAVMFLVALMGITATGTAIVWRIEQQRADEEELLFAGREFVRAIESYRAIAPSVPIPWPRTLEDLLRDPRTPTVRRHLRKVYRDPISRSSDWGLIRTPQGGIVGVYSRSSRKPVRRVPAPGLELRDGDTYEGWLFVAAGAPRVVKDARAGGWIASGPSPTPVQPTTPAGQGAATASGATGSSAAGNATRAAPSQLTRPLAP